ncbi:MAG: hypothetical protein GX616_01810 [Planctomycetes bacterium]|nr:hypothetical protein [Planctomycetota bacterium]
MSRKLFTWLALGSLGLAGCSQRSDDALLRDQPAGDGAQIRLEGRWPEGLEIDPAGGKSSIEVPAQASCAMLDISGLGIVVSKDGLFVVVAFQFRDGKAASGALFEISLLDKNKEVLGTQRAFELRNREKLICGAIVYGCDDPPNRSGGAEVRFSVPPANVDSYRLIASEPDVAGLIRLLDAEYAYPRYCAARALGQIGPSAQAAVPRLTQMLDDPELYLQDVAAEALLRIRTGSSALPAGNPETRVYDVRDIVERDLRGRRDASGHAGDNGPRGTELDAAGERDCRQRTQDLCRLIKDLIEPGTWEPEGTVGLLDIWNDRIIVRHTYTVHRRLTDVFGQVREPDDSSGSLETRFKLAVQRLRDPQHEKASGKTPGKR